MIMAAHALPVPAELLGITSSRDDVISCYLRLDPPARHRQRYLVEAKRRARHLESHLKSSGADPSLREAVHEDLSRLLDWLKSSGNLPAYPGVAIFLCGSLDLFSVIPLPRVHRDRLGIGRAPLLLELIDARETLGHYLAVLVDRGHARFFDVAASGVEELPGLPAIARRGKRFRADEQDAPGWGERAFHQRMKTEASRHHAAVAERVTHLTLTRPLAGIALLGPTEHGQGVANFLPRTTLRAVLGYARLNPTTATPAEVGQTTWLLQRQRERQEEAELVRTMEEGVPVESAVNGPADTLRALSRGQVRSLLIPDGQSGAGFRCADTDRLVLTRDECRGEGAADPVVDLVDAAIDEALAQRADVVVVDDPALAQRIDGLAALLRYRGIQ